MNKVSLSLKQCRFGRAIPGIYIEFLGKAHCQWTEGTGSRKETHTGTETYLEDRHYYAGGRTGKQ